MSHLKNYLTQDRAGFAISFELMLATELIVLMLVVSVFLMKTYEQEKYFAQVTTATCDMVARYGGNSSKAYKVQVGNGGDIRQNAEAILKKINENSKQGNKSSGFNAVFTEISNYPDNEGNVKVTLRYSYSDNGLPGVMNALGLNNSVRTISVKVPSLVQNGRLVK